MRLLMSKSAWSFLSRPIHSSTQTPWGPQRGRISIATSNSEEFNLPESEAFDVVRPRGPPDEKTSALSVLSIDIRATENKKDHNTGKYQCSNLIVRRNKEFTIIIKFDRALTEQDDVKMEFLIGSSPDENKGTYITVSIGKEKPDEHWKNRVVEIHGNDVTVGVTPDPNCIIGRFRTFVVIMSDSGKQRTQRNPDTDFYVLFNPWDPADQVYMEKEEDRQEYVMNDVGAIYNGEFNNITTRSWNFGQFEEGVLDACLMAMDAGKVPLLFRGKATEVVRQGSALMNAQDDDGVLVGNWSGDYSSGTAPTAWTGSPEILLKYAKEGFEPVCFAQCWVFAGVLNTFLRCLGIPARVITNYCSAHDNTGNLKTDIVLDEVGRVDRSRTRDSVWNYHCWNEVYMKRPDLPEKFAGWQAVDCTPQETSDGLYRCGPTSINAIKEGELSYPFDSRFVFAELNSDVVYHQSDKYGKTKIIYVDTNYVGKRLLTKKHGSSEYEDITSTYKYPEEVLEMSLFNLSGPKLRTHQQMHEMLMFEAGHPGDAGTLKEREVLQMAERRGVPTRDYLPLTETGVDIEIQADTIKIGENFRLTLKISNQTNQTCNITATITGCVVYYTGVTTAMFKLENKTATVEALKAESVTIDIKGMEYIPYLVEQSNLLFVVYGHVEETNASISTMRVITLRPPELVMKMIGSPQVGKDLMISVEFTNPYNFILKNVQLRIDGPGLIPIKLKEYRLILPGSSVKYKLSMVPKVAGKKVLMACLDCPTLRQVTSQLEIDVAK